MSVPRPTSSSSSSGAGVGPDDGGFGRPLRSKGLLPALGVGAAVYYVTGVVSLGTLGLVGIGAGVGYGVGSWIADKYQKKQEGPGSRQGVSVDQLPWAVQVAVQQWQEFVTRRAAGRELAQADIDQLWAEFEQIEPTHAMNARSLVQGQAPPPPGHQAPGGPTIVPTTAAEV
mmetsp:Transcript_53126/g.114137  ORF Transcript_53126/g.114137 Transcript_53126/m.114137 type:complete len:172 (-) Transcript_53126:131-646(-)